MNRIVVQLIPYVLAGYLLFGWSFATQAQTPTGGNIPSKQSEKLASLDNPSRDGWDSEVVSDQAKNQLKHIVALLKKSATPHASTLEHYLGAGFQTSHLRPPTLKQVYESGGIKVHRPESLDQKMPLKGSHGLAQALAELAAPFKTGEKIRIAVKLFGVTMEEQEFTTRSYVETHALLGEASLQQNTEWRCRWLLPKKDAEPLLLSIQLVDYEECRIDQKQGTLFSEVTEAVLGGNASYRDQLRYGSNHWLTRMDNMLGLDFNSHIGLAVGDANGDGLDDVYLCQGGGLPNRLYLQNADGSARDYSKQAGVDWLETSRSALFLDLDNDGDQDLIVNTSTNILLMENNGAAQYTVVKRLNSGNNSYALTAIDYDGDADLDLYVTNYRGKDDKGEAVPTPIPYHNANNGGHNMFLENRGNWTFVDITRSLGLDQNNSRFSFAAAWEDYDNDGDPDLYVANDYGHNNLYRNDNGHFSDVAEEVGLTDSSFGMAVTWGDVNRDGRSDIHISNMFSAAGSRVTRQARFKPNETAESRQRYQRLARGNSLFLNGSNNQFSDVSEAANITMGRWSWGASFADINNDGWEDLVVSNGYITSYSTDDL